MRHSTTNIIIGISSLVMEAKVTIRTASSFLRPAGPANDSGLFLFQRFHHKVMNISTLDTSWKRVDNVGTRGIFENIAENAVIAGRCRPGRCTKRKAPPDESLEKLFRTRLEFPRVKKIGDSSIIADGTQCDGPDRSRKGEGCSFFGLWLCYAEGEVSCPSYPDVGVAVLRVRFPLIRRADAAHSKIGVPISDGRTGKIAF